MNKTEFKSLIVVVFFIFFAASSSSFAFGQVEIIDATHMFEEEARAVTQGLELEGMDPGVARTRSTPGGRKQYNKGDIETFWTKNIVTNEFEQTRAVLREVGRHCYIFLEEGKTIDPKAIENTRRNFDEIIYPKNTANFGSEFKPGIDGDNRIFLLMFDIKDGYDGSGGFVGGYFYPVDSYPQSKLPPHIKSNEREILYLDINPSDPTKERFFATVAHEFQHMIHFYQDRNEYTWVNEACSQIAPYLCGYGHASQIISYMRAPDNSLTAWAKAQMLANYGQVYLWNYYIHSKVLAEVKDEKKRSAFFYNLVKSDKQGIAGFAKALQSVSTSFTSVFTRFCITNFVNDPRLSDGRYAYDKSLGKVLLPVSDQMNTFPSETKGEVFLWSADAIRIDLENARDQIEIAFEGFRGKMGIDLYNAFTVAFVLSSSRGSAAPKISFLNVKDISSSKQGGTLKAKIENGYDTGMLIIIAHAPEEVDDALYKNAVGMTYTVKLKDMGEPVSREIVSVDIASAVETYAANAETLGSKTDEHQMLIAMTQLEINSTMLERSIRQQIDNDDLSGVDKFIEILEEQRNNSEVLKPLADKISTVLKFKAFSENNSELFSRIEELKQY